MASIANGDPNDEVIRNGGSRSSASKPFLPDPGLLWLIFRRRLGIFALVFLLILLAVAAFTATSPLLYNSTASVLIEPRQLEIVDADPVSPGLNADTNVIDTEVEILSSRRLAGRVAQELDLTRYEEFGDGTASVAYDPQSPGTHPLAGAILSRMDIRRSGLTYLIEISATARDPELSAQLANEFAQQYLAQQQDYKIQASDQAQDFLQGRLVELRQNASRADAALQAYKIRNGLMSAEGATMAEQEVSVLNQEISSARANLAEKEGQLSAARRRVGRGGGGAEVPAALQSSTVAELRSREALLTGELARLSRRYGERHPEVRRAEQELLDTRSQIQLEINRILSSLGSDVEAARSRVASLEASQNRAEGSLMSNNAAQVGLLELERNAEAARAIYAAFLQRSQDVASQEGLIRPNASIETLARVPRMPSSPNYLLALLGGLTAATILGLMAVGTAEYLDARIRTRTDVEERLGLSYAGAIPDLDSTVKGKVTGVEPYDYVLDHPQSKFTEAIRALKEGMVLPSGKIPATIAITSALPREGKSTTAICLARIMAESGLSTVLVDCDARRHAVSDALLEEGDDSFTRYLRKEAELADVLRVDERSGLTVIGSRHPEPGGKEMFSRRSLSEFLTELEKLFDVVLIDTAPVLGIAESRSIAARVQGVLFLARWRDTSLKAVDTATDLLLSSSANILGLALSQVDVRKYGSTGQQDIYSYQEKFAGYYVD